MQYITLFVLATGLLGLLIGLGRGARRKIAGISAIIISVLVSMLLTPVIVNAFITDDVILSLMNTLGYLEQYNELISAGPSIAELVKGIPVALISPILFILVYLILRLIFRIIAGIVTKILFKDKEWAKSHLIGLPLGLVQGVLSAMVFVIVIAGFASTVNNITDIIMAQESEAFAEVQSDVGEIDQYVNIVADDPVVKMLDKTNFVFNSLNSFKFDGQKVVLKEEISTIADAAVYLIPLSKKTDIATWSDEEYVLLDDFVEKFGDSRILPKVSSEFLSSACEKWADGESFMGIEAPKADETINPLIIALYASLKNSDSETIVVDLSTLVDVLRIVGKYELLSGNTDDILSKINGSLVSELLNTVSKNPHFSILVPEITNLSMRMLASAINLPANTDEIHNTITSSISHNLNAYLASDKNEKATEQLKNDISSSLKDNGIEVSDEAAMIVADTIVSAFEEKETITQEDIQNYFDDYASIYEAIEKSKANSTLANDTIKLETTSGRSNANEVYDYKNMSFTDKIAALATIGVLDKYQTVYDLSSPDNILSNGMSADQFTNYLLAIYNSIMSNYEELSSLGSSDSNPIVSLKSSETIITNKTTATDLFVESKEYVLTDSDIENIAAGVENIVSFVTSLNQVEGEVSLDNLADLDLESAGKALDLLQSTELVGDKIGIVADALIGEISGSDASFSESMKENDASFEELMTTVKSTSTVLGNLSNEDISQEDIEASFLDLLFNITPATSGVIADIVTADFMIDFGIPSEFSDIAATAFKVALVEMANLPESEHNQEALKLQQLFELASSAGSSSQTVIGINGIFKTESDVIDMIVGSKVAYKTIVSISNGSADALGFGSYMDTKDKESLAKTLTEYYNDNKSSSSIPDLAGRLNAIALLFDLGITVK